jgi:DNA adenine methylase
MRRAPHPVEIPVSNSPLALRPPLKWAGGKRWQVPVLEPLWAPHTRRRMVEPFCGGAAVSLSLRPARALLNDVNPHLINFYGWLKKGFQIDIEMENDRAAYYQQRSRFNSLQESGEHGGSESAALFYYLNRTGYNGLCRFNRQGGFNVPFGRYRRINYTRNFEPFRGVFERWTLSSLDFEAITLQPEDFVYADPPYDVEFRQYASGGFTWDNQIRTAEWLTRHPGPVVLVNQATPRIRRLYRQLGYNLSFLPGPRRISCNGDRTPVREVLATRNL